MNINLFSGALLEAAAGGIGGTISTVITVVAIVFIVACMLGGFSRGMYSTALRLLCIILAAWLSIEAIHLATDYIHSMMAGETVETVITRFWPDYTTSVDPFIRDVIHCFDAETVERVLVMVIAIAVIPVAFIVVFILAAILTSMVSGLLSGILMLGRRPSGVSSLVGGIIGAVQGALIAAVFILPVAGLADVARDSRTHLIEDKDPVVSDFVEMVYTDYLDPVIDNQIVNLLLDIGGEDIYDDILTVKVGDEEVHMKKEFAVMAEIAADAVPLFHPQIFNWENLTEGDKRAITTILADVGEDPYTANTIAGILRAAAKANADDVFNLGFEEPFGSFLDEFIGVFDNVTSETVNEDLSTFVEVYFILNDYGILNHFFHATESEFRPEELLAADKDGKTIVTHVTDALSANPRTAHLVTSLTKFSFQIMADSVGNVLPEGVDTDQIYEDVKVGMEDVLASVNNPDIPPEEKKDVVKTELNNALVNAGVLSEETKLDDEVMDVISDHIMTEFEGKEELTDDDINSAILSFYNKYASSGLPGTGEGDGEGGEGGSGDDDGEGGIVIPPDFELPDDFEIPDGLIPGIGGGSGDGTGDGTGDGEGDGTGD
ncbi:MAG: CvpA family protein [Clostridia bacterium]|nr:CvpA family protein [Clostridia bacterium]